MKITKITLDKEYVDLFLNGNVVIGNDAEILQHIINKCKANNEKYTMSKSVQKIYKTLN